MIALFAGRESPEKSVHATQHGDRPLLFAPAAASAKAN
jgi:hypothetical protein